MNTHNPTFKAYFYLCLIFAAPLAWAQANQPGVRCQPINSDEVAKPQYAVENFDKNNQAFLSCKTAPGESGPDVSFTGTMPLHKGQGLSLDDFNLWNQDPALSSLFVKSTLGTHPVVDFDPDALPINPQEVDAILGNVRSRPVTTQVCGPATGGSQTCTIKQVEECKIVYGREECKMVDKEVCTNTGTGAPVCHEESTFTYFRQLAKLEGFSQQNADSFCPFGMVERQTKSVYGRVVNERRCCESKVVGQDVKYVCEEWETY